MITKRTIWNWLKKRKIAIKKLFFILKARIFSENLIYVVGDSHSLTFQNIYPYIVCHLGAATAFGLASEQSKTNSYEKIRYIVRRIRKDDFLMLSFGEIDCRQHVYRQKIIKKTDSSYEVIISEIVERYFNIIDEILIKHKKLIIYGMPPTTRQGNVYKIDHYALPEIQYKIKEIFNDMMIAKCKHEGIIYVDIFNKFCDSRGFISKEYSSDMIHLNKNAVPEISCLINKLLYVK
jgi:hypothetical protein